VRTIAQFLNEDVGRIDFSRNMLNLESLVLHPFANGVLTKFYVMSSLRGHIVRPFHTCVIVILQESWRVDVRNNITGVGDALRKVAEIDNLFGGCTCSSDFGLARTERSAILVVAKPTDRAAVFEDNATVHATKFEEREKSAVGDGAAKLGTPTSIAVGRNGVGRP
jgi:hypothetical protein